MIRVDCFKEIIVDEDLVQEDPVVINEPVQDNFLSQFSEKLGFAVPEEFENTDQLSQYMSKMSDRAAMADDYEHRIAEQGQQLEAWQNWQQQQQQQQQQYEQQYEQQQQVDPRRWQMPQNVDTRFLESDPKTGMWKAPQGYPELHSKAEEANRALRQRQEFTEQLYSDPYSFTRELVSPAMSELESRLMERISQLEGQIQPVAAQSYASQLQNYEWENKDVIYEKGPDGNLIWSAAGELYQDYLELGADPQKAMEMARQRSTPQYPETPSEVKNSWLQRAKTVSRDTNQPTQAAGTVATALRNGDSQTTTKMSGRARFKQYVQEAEQEVAESA